MKNNILDYEQVNKILDKFAEDKKESSEEMFSFTSCAFFCCLR